MVAKFLRPDRVPYAAAVDTANIGSCLPGTLSVLEFAYDAMKEPSTHIRLCHIRPKVSGSPLDIIVEDHFLEDIKYHFAALSYAWGDRESGCPITVNGLAFRDSSAVLT
jgi:hypothetical protein